MGKATDYQSRYAPELLYPIPRQLKRSEIGIVDAALPFVGEDLWNAYELSWLNPEGQARGGRGLLPVYRSTART